MIGPCTSASAAPTRAVASLVANSRGSSVLGDLGEIRPRLLLALSGSCSTGLERRPSDAKAEEKSPHPTRIGAIVQPSRLCQPVSIAVRRTILREAYEFIVPQDFWKI